MNWDEFKRSVTKVQRFTIQKIILNMDKPFTMSELFSDMRESHKIRNYDMITEALDELCIMGHVTYEVNERGVLEFLVINRNLESIEQ